MKATRLLIVLFTTGAFAGSGAIGQQSNAERSFCRDGRKTRCAEANVGYFSESAGPESRSCAGTGLARRGNDWQFLYGGPEGKRADGCADFSERRSGSGS